MANKYTWKIEQLDCLPSFEGQTTVVNIIHWRVTASDDKNSTSIYGAQPVTYAAGEPFTAFSSLTEDTVVDWVQTAMGSEKVAAVKTSLNEKLLVLANPPVIFPSLPWLA